MTKTQATRDLERDIWRYTHEGNKYVAGAFEVTVGYIAFAQHYERVDYVTIGTDGTIRAYELKTSVSDYHISAKLSWIGHYNYLVLTQDVYDQVKQVFPYRIGVLVMDESGKIHQKKKPSRHQHSVGECAEIVESMLKAASRDAGKYYMQEEGSLAK
jgi:hypothetical protein